MKIGIDVRCLNGKMTGVGNYVHHLLDGLLAIRPNDHFYLYSNKNICCSIDGKNMSKRIGTTLYKKSGVIWLYTEGKNTVVNDNIDVFWAPSGMLPKLPSTTKTILTIHDFVWKSDPRSMPLKFMLANRFLTWSSIKNANLISTNSQAVSDELKSNYKRAADDIIRPAASEEFYPRCNEEIEAVSCKYSLPKEYLLIVGTLEPRKNLKLFIETYMSFCSEVPLRVMPYLAIVGGKGWKDQDLNITIATAEAKGLAKRLGYVINSDLPALYSGAKAFFMPSRYEGFGMPALEARCCGTPLIISDVPAMHEAAGEVAWYHPPTHQGIYSMLHKILHQNELPPRPDCSAVDWSWSSGANKLSTLINELCC